MTVDFVRFKASDGVELHGWLSSTDSDLAIIHMHGMSGNGYENYFLDELRKLYVKHDISFFTLDSRGRGIISDFRMGDVFKHAGSCFEIFEESAYDIQGSIDFLKSKGKKRFIIQGHSLGATKVVNYLMSKHGENILAVILLAPTDMVGWAKTDPHHNEYLKKAEALLRKKKPEELVNAQSWIDKTPLSAQTYPSISKKEGNADIYGDRKGGALLSRIKLPMLIVYGDQDIGAIKIDGSIDNWLKRMNKIKNMNTKIQIIKGALHGFRGFEKDVAKKVEPFIKQNK